MPIPASSSLTHKYYPALGRQWHGFIEYPVRPSWTVVPSLPTRRRTLFKGTLSDAKQVFEASVQTLIRVPDVTTSIPAGMDATTGRHGLLSRPSRGRLPPYFTAQWSPTACAVVYTRHHPVSRMPDPMRLGPSLAEYPTLPPPVSRSASRLWIDRRATV